MHYTIKEDFKMINENNYKSNRVLQALENIRQTEWTTEELEYLAQEVDTLYWSKVSDPSDDKGDVDKMQNLTMGILLDRIEKLEDRVTKLEK
jgi:hypothetical protein